MSSSVLTSQTKYGVDKEQELLVSPYLTPSNDKPEKQSTFASDSSTVVSIDLDSLPPDGLTVPLGTRGRSPGPPINPSGTKHDSGLRGWWKSMWRKNKAPLLMFSAQLFGALMNLTARLLEVEEEGMHPMQLLFARMTITVMCSSLYIWWKKIPHGLLGPRDVRWLLMLRGFSGFFGIYGMWYSVKYIPLAEATVITFLAPNIAGYMCHIFIHDPFTRKEQLASFVALGGVALITRPVSLFSGSPTSVSPAARDMAAELAANVTVEEVTYPGGEHITTSAERLTAIGFALLGVLGAAGAITTLRCIGKRAHPLVSVNYFSTWCVIVTTTTLSLAPVFDYGQPDLRLEIPDSIRKWVFLLVIGACGVIMQVLMTAGLACEKSNRATAMIYTHMLFAAAFDRWVFGHTMGWTSLTGCGLIVGSALWVALTKESAKEKGYEAGDAERGPVNIGVASESESAPMLYDEVGVEEEEEGIVLRRLSA